MSDLNNETTDTASNVIDHGAQVRKGPLQRVSNAPRTRFALMNASTSSESVLRDSAPTKRTQEQPYAEKKKKVDPLKDKYRDRAEERRLRGPEELLEETAELDAEALRERRERSKYLGGSEETTHLVEGLDIMLYERRKLEIELEAKRKREAEASASETTLLGAKQLVIDQYGQAKAVDAPQTFQSPLGRGVYNALFRRELRPAVDTFLPGRTTYVFSIDPQSRQELPDIIERSMLSDTEEKTGRDIRMERFSAATSDNALEKLSIVMSYLKQGDKGLKKRRKELEERELRAKAVVAETLQKVMGQPTTKPQPKMDIDEDEEDIFGDVSKKEYVPTTTAQKEVPKQSTAKAPGSGNSDGRMIGDVSAKRSRDEMTTSNKDGTAHASSKGTALPSTQPDPTSDDDDMFAMDTVPKAKKPGI